MKNFLITLIYLLPLFPAAAQDKHIAPLTDIVRQISKSWQDIDEGEKNKEQGHTLTMVFSKK